MEGPSGVVWYLALGWWEQRNNGPECEPLREEVGWDVGSGLIGLHMKDLLCRLALGKAVSLASVRPQMLQIRKCFIQCLAQDPLVTNRCYHQGRNTSEFGRHLSGALS